MQNAKPYYTRKATNILLKSLDSTYAKAYLKHVSANATQLNAEEITQPLRLLEDSDGLFDVTVGEWYTETINPELKPGSKQFNIKYDIVHIINKETVRKDIKRLVEMGVLTPVK